MRKPPRGGFVIARASGVSRSGSEVVWEVISGKAGNRYWLVQLDKASRRSTVLRETTDLMKAHRWSRAIVRLDRQYRRATASQLGAVLKALDKPGNGRDVEGIGYGGYAAPKHGETRMQYLRRLAEKRRRYRRLTQSQGEQGPGYDQRRTRRRRRRRR